MDSTICQTSTVTPAEPGDFLFLVKKSAPLVIWRLVEILRPIHLLLEAMAHKASEYEKSQGKPIMIIPHYEDFFYFLLADKATIKRRKRWLDIFNN